MFSKYTPQNMLNHSLSPSVWSYIRRKREYGGHTKAESGQGFRDLSASCCWVRGLAGWYMTYISCKLMLFWSGHLFGGWLEWQTHNTSVHLSSSQATVAGMLKWIFKREHWRAPCLSRYMTWSSCLECLNASALQNRLFKNDHLGIIGI